MNIRYCSTTALTLLLRLLQACIDIALDAVGLFANSEVVGIRQLGAGQRHQHVEGVVSRMSVGGVDGAQPRDQLLRLVGQLDFLGHGD